MGTSGLPPGVGPGAFARRPATTCLSRTSYLRVGDQLNPAAPPRRGLAARPAGSGWAAPGAGMAREIAAYLREVEPQAATLPAEASPAELLGVGVAASENALPAIVLGVRQPDMRVSRDQRFAV